MMSRHAKTSQSPAPFYDEDIYDATPEPPNSRRAARAPPSLTLSPSPAVSISSDKENRASQTVVDKGKGRAMAPPKQPTPLSDPERASAGKRKRNEDREAARNQNRRRRTAEPEEVEIDSDGAYDPDQSIEERRKLRRQLRNLHRDLNDNRAEYLNPASTGLLDTLKAANYLASNVKQTADATIDSRLLVTTADLSYKKTIQLTLGDSIQGVDIDEFVSKCITFMRKGDVLPKDSSQAPASTQRRRRQRLGDDSDGEDGGDGDDGDENNWEHLGEQICLQYNSRPPVPGFLLGPLSLEKRARKATQRSNRLKISNLKQTQPEIISTKDIEKAENANLTVLCQRILGRLNKVTNDGIAAVEAEATDDMSKAEVKSLMDKHGVQESGGVDLFRFVVNPYSFGQTVENLFYVSFLIRDGKAGINIGEDGLPALEATQPRGRSDATKKGVSKHQAVLAIDMAQWRELIEVFNIKQPMIPHREEEVQEQPGARGWYS